MSTTAPTSTTTNSTTTDLRYRDPEFLRQKYEVEGLSQAEIAELCDCTSSTISDWLQRFGIDTRSYAERASDRPANFSTSVNGYERWQCHGGESNDSVYVHRLLATLEVEDLSELDGQHVHHKNHCPFDNQPENIEVLSPEQHAKRHAEN